MKMKKHPQTNAPLWKKIVVIFIVIAMPLFFAYYRSMQTERAANFTAPQTNQQDESKPDNS